MDIHVVWKKTLSFDEWNIIFLHLKLNIYIYWGKLAKKLVWDREHSFVWRDPCIDSLPW